MIAAALIALTLQAVPAQATATAPATTAPAWATLPRPSFPRAASHARIRAASVHLSCTITMEGRITACSLIDETPPGYGFGEAALKAMRVASMTPATLDGHAVEQVAVFPITFRIAGS